MFFQNLRITKLHYVYITRKVIVNFKIVTYLLMESKN